jgi:hypothetical protein
MKNRTYNPYPKLGQQFKDGLDYIKDNLLTPAPPEVTLEEINDSVAEYLQTIFGDEENGDEFNILSSLISSLIPTAANSYQNNQLFNESFFSQTQVMLISSIMEAIKSNSVEGINSVLEDAEEEISKSGLSASEQAPLFMAVTYAKASNAYWTEVISSPGQWENFISSNAAINHANLPFWTLASFESALNGYAQIQQLDTPSANLVNTAGRTIAILAALTATLGVSAGKILLKFVQRPGTNGFSASRIANFDKEQYILRSRRCATGGEYTCPSWSAKDVSCLESMCVCTGPQGCATPVVFNPFRPNR